jgi:hypothetical protein
MVLLGNPQGYHSIEVGHIPAHKIKKILKNGGKLHLTAEELSGHGHHLHLHPESHKKAHMAKHKHKGVHLIFSEHELRHNIHHGGSLWNSIKAGAKKVGNFLSDHGTDILNGIEGAVNAVAPELAPYTSVARQVAKAVTGKGIKRTKEQLHAFRLENLEKARHARKGKIKASGSFLQAGY